MFYKNISNGYIVSISTGGGMVQIEESEYETLLSIIRSAPVAEDGYCYMLRADNLELEMVELPPIPEPEPTTEEVIDYLFGGDAE